mmetsp:Transcript_7229/g.45130  ORF Transcript_7229/g.45130 Transcript_7229/m.45130 type:complete len:215 (-) Transcript_7229:77-721(-)
MGLGRSLWTCTRRGGGRPCAVASELRLGVGFARLRIVPHQQLLRLLVRRAILQLRHHGCLFLPKGLQASFVSTFAPIHQGRGDGVHHPREQRHHGERKQADGHLLQRVFAKFRLQHRHRPTCTRDQEQQRVSETSPLPSPPELLPSFHAFLQCVRFSIDSFQGAFVARVVWIGRPRSTSQAGCEAAHGVCRTWSRRLAMATVRCGSWLVLTRGG